MKTEGTDDPRTFTLTLTLTEEEAEVLHAVMRNIAGDLKGARNVTESIRKELSRLGVSARNADRIGGSLKMPDSWWPKRTP